MRRIREYAFVPIILISIVAVLMMCEVAEAKEIEIPQEIEAACEKYGKMYNIQPEFLEAVAFQESTFRPHVVDKTGTCHGLMQISYSAHEERMKKLGVTDIYSVDGNIHTAADYLAELFAECENPPVALAKYNGQSKQKVYAAEYDGYISSYAQSILDLTRELEIQHGKVER